MGTKVDYRAFGWEAIHCNPVSPSPLPFSERNSNNSRICSTPKKGEEIRISARRLGKLVTCHLDIPRLSCQMERSVAAVVRIVYICTTRFLVSWREVQQSLHDVGLGCLNSHMQGTLSLRVNAVQDTGILGDDCHDCHCIVLNDCCFDLQHAVRGSDALINISVIFSGVEQQVQHCLLVARVQHFPGLPGPLDVQDVPEEFVREQKILRISFQVRVSLDV
mmetsp:Transcript_6251/g.17480  ORF Transcript_6251/g.17480 Transcript_6251/m.17480 type:complete len:220 (+) Transcript_6251:1071-1730(+)